MPLWVRAIISIDGAIQHAVRVKSAIRDEITWTWTTASTRGPITAAIYAQQGTYFPGGAIHSRGLFDWEREVLTREPFASRGRWLLGGAGGGRELFAILNMGHSVLAFEPCEALYTGAQSALGDRPEGSIRLASYSDLVMASEGLRGPLEEVVAWHPDAVVLGWGSFSHVQSESERQRLLRAVKRVAPDAPVLLSFLTPTSSKDGAVATLRRAVNVVSRALNAPEEPEPWTPDRGFLPHGGFVALLTDAGIRETASQAGYSVERCEMYPYPHAVLLPH